MIEDQIPEDLHLDYKEKGSLVPTARGSNRPDKQKRAEDISKDVSSFLNSDGGVLIYGVPETQDPNLTGGSPVPGGSDIGFLREDIRKETIEDLITSNIQPKPGSELFRVVEVPFGDEGRVVFLVEVTVGIGGVWQAKDRRYYRRFQFKAEPMEHYEIELVRNRSLAPDLRLVFGINDRWEREMSNLEYLSRRGEEFRIHVGVQNSSNAVADSALVEFGVWPLEDGDAMMKIDRGEFPGGVIPGPFLPAGIRNITWEDADSQLAGRGVSVAWSRMFWNDSNPALAERYAPLFRTDLALPVGVVNLRNVNWSRGIPKLFALCFWRIQAHNMEPREGIVEVCSPNDPSGPPSLPCIRLKETRLTVA